MVQESYDETVGMICIHNVFNFCFLYQFVIKASKKAITLWRTKHSMKISLTYDQHTTHEDGLW